MAINDRVRFVRNWFKLTQKDFGEKIAVAQTYLSQIEKGDRDVTEKIFKIICAEFNVREEWLRDGSGEMLVQLETFSLDEYAKANGLSELEFDIIKGYIELDADLRHKVLSHFKGIFDKHAEVAATKENNIEKKLESYRLELEAEEKGETSLASHQPKGKLG